MIFYTFHPISTHHTFRLFQKSKAAVIWVMEYFLARHFHDTIKRGVHTDISWISACKVQLNHRELSVGSLLCTCQISYDRISLINHSLIWILSPRVHLNSVTLPGLFPWYNPQLLNMHRSVHTISQHQTKFAFIRQIPYQSPPNPPSWSPFNPIYWSYYSLFWVFSSIISWDYLGFMSFSQLKQLLPTHYSIQNLKSWLENNSK